MWLVLLPQAYVIWSLSIYFTYFPLFSPWSIEVFLTWHGDEISFPFPSVATIFILDLGNVCGSKAIHAFWRPWDSHHGTISKFWDLVVCPFVWMSVSVYWMVRYQHFGLSHVHQNACRPVRFAAGKKGGKCAVKNEQVKSAWNRGTDNIWHLEVYNFLAPLFPTVTNAFAHFICYTGPEIITCYGLREIG